MASSLSPTLIPNQQIQSATSSSSDRARRKRKNKQPPPSQPSLSPSPSRASLQRWRSEKQQQIYFTEVVQALRQLRINQSPDSVTSSKPRGGRAVREAADRALAVAARGRRLWSRAILARGSVKLKFRKQKKRPRISPPATASASAGVENGRSRSRKQKLSILRLKKKSLPAVQRKVKVLSRMVPGCRKQSLAVILEEAADYIAAKQMQIRAMTAVLSAASPIAAPPPPSPSPAPPTPPPPAHSGGQTHMLG